MTGFSRQLLVGALIAPFALTSCAGVSTDAHADLVAYQAIYKMELSASSPTSRFNGLRGAAVSQIERTCEGWVVSEQVVMTMLTVAGGAIEREMNFKARESFDGQAYFFESNAKTNGQPEQYSGSARRTDDTNAEAEFVTPKPFQMPLPKGTLFYVGLTEWLIDLVKSGARTGQTISFDGTDDEGAQKVSAFILPDSIGGEGLNGDPKLLDAKAWKVRLAFFETDEQVSEPDFEIALRLLENGIVTHYELIFNDLIVDQTLEDVLPAKDEHCG